MDRIGVIIVNTGSPAAPTSEAVADYLRLFLADPLICPVHPRLWNLILNRFIIPKRAPLSATKYASIWTDAGSPLNVSMASLAQKLADAWDGGDIACLLPASSYSAPTIEDALAECQGQGCTRIIVVPLYPQSAFSTTEAVRRRVTEAMEAAKWTGEVCFVDSYSEEDAYVTALADAVRASGFDVAGADRLLFVFHSIPMTDIRKGDTYGEQTRRTAESVARSLGLEGDAWRIGYQCRFDRSRQWLSPYTKDVLAELTDAKRLFVIAPNFAVDCLETLYDIQEELRAQWSTRTRNPSDPGSFHYIPCLNDSDAQVSLLKGVIAAQL